MMGPLTGLAAAASLFAATAAQAGGFYLQEQSVRAAGRAFSGEAADTGAASLWWNPAAIGPILVDGRVRDARALVFSLGGRFLF